MTRLLAVVLGSVVLAAGGCGAAGDGRPDGTAQTPEPVRLVEEARIGSDSTFTQVPDIAPAPDGGVWVLDGGTREVIRFDDEGREVLRLGGSGQAQDRFEYPRRLHLRGDTLWVEDLGAARWSAWNAGTGAFLESYDLPADVAGGNVAWTARGLMGVASRREGEERLRYGGRWRPDGGLFVRVDSLPAPPVPEALAIEATLTRQGRPMTMVFPLPLAHQPSAQPLASGDGWLVAPGSGAYRILEVDDAGRTRREFSRDYAPVPVPPAERQAAVERIPVDLRGEAERVPTEYPPFDRVVEGADGRVWVVRRAADGEGSTRLALDLFEADGRYLGEVESALGLEGFWLHHAGPDAVWGVQRDERGLPVVFRLGVSRGGGGGAE